MRTMAGSVNKVILIGNVGRDPEIRTLQNGGRVASFTLATSESWKDRTSGERREKTEWHRIAVYNESLVGVIERFVKKGWKPASGTTRAVRKNTPPKLFSSNSAAS